MFACECPYSLCKPPQQSCFRSGFRGELQTFRKMGAIKPALVLHYMQHYSLSKISLSDTDTVWLRNPQGKRSHQSYPPLLSYMRTALHIFCLCCISTYLRQH